MCVIFIESNDDRDTEPTCSEEFSSFIMDELLPWAEEEYKINKHESNNLIAGFSYGGLTAAYIGYKYPQVFSKVLYDFWRCYYEPL